MLDPEEEAVHVETADGALVVLFDFLNGLSVVQ